jgi:DNA-binding phage protein
MRNNGKLQFRHDRFRAAREKRNLSVEDVAAALSVPPAYVEFMEQWPGEGGYDKFAALILARTKQLEINLSEIARRANLSRTHVCNLAQGVSPTAKAKQPKQISPQVIDAIAAAIEVPPVIARRVAGLPVFLFEIEMFFRLCLFYKLSPWKVVELS